MPPAEAAQSFGSDPAPSEKWLLRRDFRPQFALFVLLLSGFLINAFLYLYRYPIGHLIAFQLEEKLREPESGKAFESAASSGRVLSDLWMEATGTPVVAEPIPEATVVALRALGG